MRKSFYLSLLIVLFTAYELVAFQGLSECVFSPYSGIAGMEVAYIGDRQIYTLFTEGLVNERDAVFEAFSNSSSPTHFSMMLNEIIDNNKVVIASEQPDVQKIVDLSKIERLDWIGIETSPERLEDNPIDQRIRAYSDNQNFLNTNLNPLDGWDSDKTDKVLSLIYNPYVIAIANNRDIFNGVKIALLDDEDLRQTENQYYDSVDHYESLLLENYHTYPSVSRSTLEKIFHFIRSTTNRPELIMISQDELEEFLDEFRFEEEARIYMRRIVEMTNNATSISRQRDQNAVTSILNQQGNGLVLFGAAHGPGIKKGLTTACENNL